MDWSASDYVPLRRPEPPAPELLETCWCVQASGGPVFTCGIYRDAAPGLEVRVWGRSEDDLLRSQRTLEIGNARELASGWRQRAPDKGFSDLSCAEE